MALFRMAAAAGILLVLAPEQTRTAIGALFSGAEDARRAIPTKEEATEAALAFCRKNPEVCARAARQAMEAEKRLSP